MPVSPYEVEIKGRNIAIVHIPFRGPFEQRFLLTADRHWDNPMSNHDMKIKHMKQAEKYKAGIIDIGDLFCAMQGKFDKRSDKDNIRPEHLKGDYLDSLWKTAARFFKPYAERFIMIGMGNHETAVLRNHETNLTNNLIERLNEQTKSNIYNGGYSGWIQFVFHDKWEKTDRIVKMWYIHGYGGGGPVTKGVIESNRRTVYLPDADIVISGHIHESWNLTLTRNRLKSDGIQHLEDQEHIQLPTYKEEYQDGYEGFHIERGRYPKPIGAKWLLFRKEEHENFIQYDVLKAR